MWTYLLENRRKLVDRTAAGVISLGGYSVIGIIALIFIFLFGQILPLFLPADEEVLTEYSAPAPAAEQMLLDEYGQTGLWLDATGVLREFSGETGEVLKTFPLLGTAPSSSARHDNLLLLGYPDGALMLIQTGYSVSYGDDGSRTVRAQLEYPLGEEPLRWDGLAGPIVSLSVLQTEERLTLAAAAGDAIQVRFYSRPSGFAFVDARWQARGELNIPLEATPDLDGARRIMIGGNRQRFLFVQADARSLAVYDLADDARLHALTQVVEEGASISVLERLSGGNSLLIGTSDGGLSQWFTNVDEAETFVRAREFDPLEGGPVRGIVPEQGRRGFIAFTDADWGIYHSTAGRRVLHLEDAGITAAAINSRSDRLLLNTASGARYYGIENEHPDVSWTLMWGQVWYEGYVEPSYQWQSSSASSDYEPKLSLVPLSLGTLKATFYAMLFAIPLGLAGAVYTAVFMAPEMRRMIKPTVELMAALPTVILGFLGGLMLAPFIESHLPGMVLFLVLFPLLVVLVSLLWQWLPGQAGSWSQRGWTALILLPLPVLIGWTCIALSPGLEARFFGGDAPAWITANLGISFDQRNALVVGVAMGFAVVPTIFSIAEDALFGVPKQLISGSLALGASMWHTTMHVVLPTASPGIFSALMIGMGRAVGETMIVLMATGNTPLLNFNMFEGMRTLSANIAVEMPEAEVDSTHYRVLFLCALVLFVFTFILNTTAEAVRQRLRERYGSL